MTVWYLPGTISLEDDTIRLDCPHRGQPQHNLRSDILKLHLGADRLGVRIGQVERLRRMKFVFFAVDLGGKHIGLEDMDSVGHQTTYRSYHS